MTTRQKRMGMLVAIGSILAVCLYVDFGMVRTSADAGRLMNRAYRGATQLGVAGSLFAVATYAAGFWLLLTLWRSRAGVLRTFAIVLTAAGCLVNLGYRWTTYQGFGYADALTALSELGFAGDAIGAYAPKLLAAVAVTTVLVAALIFVTRRWQVPAGRREIMASGGALLLLFSISPVRNLSAYLPSPLKVPAVSLSAAWGRLQAPGALAGREQVRRGPTRPPVVKHLIFIMDETIRADLLSINNPHVTTTPFLASLGDTLINFGIATAASNLSANTNLIVLTDAKLDELPDPAGRLLQKPNLFQFAKKAGMTTHYLDSQIRWNDRQPFLRQIDEEYIDNYHLVRRERPDVPESGIDHALIDYLQKIVSSEKPTFTYVVKSGCHFDYADRFVEEDVTLEPGEAMRNINPAVKQVVGDYLKAVRWNVDLFFEKLTGAIRSSDAMVVYTGDHGESFFAHGGTHGWSENAPPEQVMVPFFALPMDRAVSERLQNLRAAARRGFDKATHFMVGPTLLELIGYMPPGEEEPCSVFADALPLERRYVVGDLFGQGEFRKLRFQADLSAFRSRIVPNSIDGPHIVKSARSALDSLRTD